MKQIGAVLTALCITFLCGVHISAAQGQQIVNLPVRAGLHRWDFVKLEQEIGGPFYGVCISLPPDKKDAVLYLDGKPLTPYRVITPEQVRRVQMFTASGRQTVSVGVLVFPGGDAPEKVCKIRSINPCFW